MWMPVCTFLLQGHVVLNNEHFHNNAEYTLDNVLTDCPTLATYLWAHKLSKQLTCLEEARKGNLSKTSFMRGCSSTIHFLWCCYVASIRCLRVAWFLSHFDFLHSWFSSSMVSLYSSSVISCEPSVYIFSRFDRVSPTDILWLQDTGRSFLTGWSRRKFLKLVLVDNLHEPCSVAQKAIVY